MPLYERVGRLLLLGAVAFWWGGFVVPHLISLASSELLPLYAIPRQLNAGDEGTFANAVSAGALLTVAFLALANVVVSNRKSAGWITLAGWATLAVTAAYLVWEEFSDFHITGLTVVGQALLDKGLVEAVGTSIWTVLLSPLIVAFVVAMWLFVHKGLPSTSSGWAVRAPLILGFAAWLLAVVYEASYPFLFAGGADMLEIVLEETLEFGGTLLIGLSAAMALRNDAVSRAPSSGAVYLRQIGGTIVGSIGAVAMLGGLTIAFVFRAPLVDARIPSRIGAFNMILQDGQSVLQEIGGFAAPLASLDLRMVNRDPDSRLGVVRWRIVEPVDGSSGRIFREGRMEVPAGEHPKWMSIDFPPLVEVLSPEPIEEPPLALQLIVDVEPEAHLRIGATKTNRYEEGRLWVDGALGWPDQNLEFAAYGASEPTLSKFRGLWHSFTSDWRWPALLAELAIALTFITFIPILLVTVALPRRSLGPPGAQ